LHASHDPARVNISKYKSQRSILSADKDISPEAINDLLVRAGKPVRGLPETEKSAMRTGLGLSCGFNSSGGDPRQSVLPVREGASTDV
jgi:hypothetical protein